MNLAKSLGAADEYIELSRKAPAAQYKQLKADNPYGFDIVVEATGGVTVLEDAINYVRRGGKLVVYGVYNNFDTVSWPPTKICKSFAVVVVVVFSVSPVSSPERRTKQRKPLDYPTSPYQHPSPCPLPPPPYKPRYDLTICLSPQSATKSPSWAASARPSSSPMPSTISTPERSKLMVL